MKLFKIFLLATFLTSCGYPGKGGFVPMVGLDDKSEPVLLYLPTKMNKKIGKTLHEMQSEMSNEFQSLHQSRSWHISRIDFNFILTLGVDVGVLGIDVSPAFRLVFTND